MKVWVAVFDGHYSNDVRVFDSPEKAEAWRQEIVDEWFDVELISDEPPSDPSERADMYFNVMAQRFRPEFFFTQECDVL